MHVVFAVLIAAAAAVIPTPAPMPSLPPVPKVAPGLNPPPAQVPSGSLVGITQQPFVGITLDNALGMALTGNPDVIVAQANQRIAQYRIVAAQGAYDIHFSVEP